MTKRNVMISILTSRLEVGIHLFEEGEDFAPNPLDFLPREMPEPTEMLVEGRLVTNADRVELVYDESPLSGMMGSVTAIGFDRANPGLVTMMRSGTVFAAMSFEEGKRHISVYDTPFSSFQICIRTLCVKNTLLTDGKITLEYLIEFHGAQAEHCRMTISTRPAENLF